MLSLDSSRAVTARKLHDLIERDHIEITLNRVLNQHDIIRIDHENEDVNLSVTKLYDRNGDLINKSEDVCYIKIKEKLSSGDIVYKTKDYLYYKAS